MDLHNFCVQWGVPMLSVVAIGVGLGAMKVDILKMLKLQSLRQILQYASLALGVLCLVDWFNVTRAM